jgi:hypothetical protein
MSPPGAFLRAPRKGPCVPVFLPVFCGQSVSTQATLLKNIGQGGTIWQAESLVSLSGSPGPPTLVPVTSENQLCAQLG